MGSGSSSGVWGLFLVAPSRTYQFDTTLQYLLLPGPTVQKLKYYSKVYALVTSMYQLEGLLH